MESGGSGAGGDSNGDGDGVVQKTCCIEERAAGQVASMGRGGGGGDGDGNNRWMTHDTIGAWCDADGWCDQWYWRYRRCQLLIGHACNNRSDLVWESPVITGKLCLG